MHRDFRLHSYCTQMEESRGVYEAATQQLGSFLDLVSAQMLEPQDRYCTLNTVQWDHFIVVTTKR